MKNITKSELAEILNRHRLWLNNDPAGKRAVLSNTDLSIVDMHGANLHGANLHGANLSYAYLAGADLSKATLSDADLRNTIMSGANLSYAHLNGANLFDARLSNVDLCGAVLPKFQIIPETGQFRCYKKVSGNTILELLVSKNAKRTSSLVGRKCRASKVKVLRVVEGDLNRTQFHSRYDSNFINEVGKWVEEPNYVPDIRIECTNGIHFFVTLEEAREY